MGSCSVQPNSNSKTLLSRRKAGSVTEIVAGSISYGKVCIVGLGLKKTRPVFRFLKKLKPQKPSLGFLNFYCAI